MNTYETLTLLASITATVIAFVALYRTHRVSKRQIELQEIQTTFAKFQHEILAKEYALKNKADVRVYFAKIGRSEKVIFENLGPADALEVRFTLGIPEDESPFVDSDVKAHFPIARLRKGEQVKVMTAITLSTPLPLPISIDWQEEDGTPKSSDFKLSL